MSDKIINIDNLKHYNDKINQTKQDILISGQNIKTINGKSILGEGDLTIEDGVKVYTWNWDGESQTVTLSQEEYDNILEATIVIVNLAGVASIIVNKTGKEFSEDIGDYALIGRFDSQGSKFIINISIKISTKLATITLIPEEIPTKTSQLENDSNFISSDNLKTINGESIVGSGDIVIEDGTYIWELAGSESGTITQDQWDALQGADNILIRADGVINTPQHVDKTESSIFMALAMHVGLESWFYIDINISSNLTYTINVQDVNYIRSGGLKTINGESLEGIGNIEISSGNPDANVSAVDTSETLDDVDGNTYVKYVAQTLTEEQKAQARENIGAGGTSAQSDWNETDVTSAAYIANKPDITLTGAGDLKINSNSYIDLNANWGVNIRGPFLRGLIDITGGDFTSNSSIRFEDTNGDYLASLIFNGDGTKFLSNDGTYKEVSGGSSSGSSAYSEVSHGTADTTFTLTPNTFHIWDEVSALTLTLGAETSGVANEYLFQFTSGSEPTTLSLPDDIKWTGGETLTIEANKIYQISILKGLGSVLEWDSVSLIENKLTLTDGDMTSGSTLTFAYPTASELTLTMQYYSSDTLIVPIGTTSITIDWFEPMAPQIIGINPISDSTYKYIM